MSPSDSDEMPTAYVPLAEQPVETTIHLADGTFVKSFRVAKANTVLPQHSHAYSHTSYIATGAVKAWKDGVFLRTVTAPDGILIEAHAKHLFQTLTDDTTLLCIHNIALGEQPEIEDEHQVLVGPTPQPPARPRLSMDGFTFEDEPFDTWFTDARDLFREHMAATGQGLDDWARKNIPLCRQMDAAGAMQIITARSSNGAMHGYLMALLSPDLDDPTARMAQLLPLFASPTCPGLGLKLMRASIDAFRARGITEVIARAGTRGSGPRLGVAYRRLGFKDAGTMYRLDLKGTR